MDGDGAVDWTSLPPEIYPLIADRLKTHIEFLRFRSVCTSWRSSVTPFAAPIPLRFPFPYSDGAIAFLTEITVHLLRPDPDPNSVPSPPSSSKGFLLKVEEFKDKLDLLNPLTSCPNEHRNAAVPTSPTGLNLLDYQMVELRKGYALRYRNGSGPIFGINKVILAPNFEDRSIFIIYNKQDLGFAQNEGRGLIAIRDQMASCDDMTAYKGHPYVVDNFGTLFRIDSSLKSLPISSLLVGTGHRKNLIECDGELYLVDRHLCCPNYSSQEVPVDYGFFRPRHLRRRQRGYEVPQLEATDFKVYKLDEELGEWGEVKSLGGHAFFLCVDCCFSVVAGEVEGCKGNAIYYTDSDDIGLALRGLTRPDGSVFSLDDHSIERLGASSVYSNMFRPLPAESSALI